MKSLILTSLLLFSLGPLSGLAPLPAQAQTSDAEASARAHFARGQELTDASRFRDAFDEFSAGYALSQRPLFLFNMAECARQAGAADAAVENYQRYLREDPAGSHAALAQERLTQLRPGTTEEVETQPAPSAVESMGSPPEERAAATVPDLSLQANADALQNAVWSDPGTPASSPSVFESWVFWATVGGVIVAGALIAVLISVAGPSEVDCGANCLDLR